MCYLSNLAVELFNVERSWSAAKYFIGVAIPVNEWNTHFATGSWRVWKILEMRIIRRIVVLMERVAATGDERLWYL